MTVPITGVGTVPVNQEEKTSQKLLDEYLNLMKRMQEIFDKPVFMEGDYKNLQEIMEALKKLAQEGDSTSSPGMTYYMPADMLRKLNAVFSVLELKGITIGGAGSIDEILKKMKDVQEFTDTVDGKEVRVFAYILSKAGNLASPTQNLQDQLYNDFVIGANEALEKKLAILEEQLKLTAEVTKLLKELQDLRNKLIIAPPGTVYDGNGAPKQTAPVVGELKLPEDLVEFLKKRDELQKLLDQFPKVDEKGQAIVYEEGTAPHALAKVLADINGLNDGYFKDIDLDTLPKSEQEVIDLLDKDQYSIPASDWYTAINSLNQWLKNDAGEGGGAGGYKAGPYADNLSKAMTAIQSLSDTQKEELRSQMYIYEQFMKVAIDVMAKITKSIEELARAIGR